MRQRAPSLMVAQKKRYLDFLNQIRRENEGDDTADSPGYSLNLVRIPVSVLPGVGANLAEWSGACEPRP